MKRSMTVCVGEDAIEVGTLAFEAKGTRRSASFVYDGMKTTVPLVNNHFQMLRRFADELLKSQELLKLAD